MKRLPGIFILITLLFSGCSPDPAGLTTNFLDALHSKQYNVVEKMVSPQIGSQISVIRRDKAALFNGQDWNYAEVKDNAGTVAYKLLLNDGTQIWQQAKLKNTADGWKIETIENKKILCSTSAIKTREYWQHTSQTLITPLDIEDITKQKLESHLGQFVMVSGYLCSFEDKKETVVMTMGAEDSVPLLAANISGPAAYSAKREHATYSKIDAMVETPLGNMFTAIGSVHSSGGKFVIAIDNPQNIIIGQVLRREKPVPGWIFPESTSKPRAATSLP